MDQFQGPEAGGLTAGEYDARIRGRLLRAAVEVFDRKGYAAASVREIVEQAGATKPVLYYHFGSKEGILVAILEEGARQVQAAVSRAVARPGSARERLAALCAEVFALFRQHVPIARVAHAVYFGPRAVAPTFDFDRFGRTLDAGLRQVVEDGVVSGEFRPCRIDDVLTAIKGIIEVCTHRELDPEAPPIGCDGLGRVLDILFDGLSAAITEKEN